MDERAAQARAVVVGAGFAGLLAARVLSDRFAEVVIIERDTDNAAVPRRGVPQGRHLHGLLDHGRALLEQLHPGITAELVDAGALLAEPLVDTCWYLHGRRLRPTPTGLRSVLASRPLLEHVLRTRTTALPGVSIEQGDVTGLVTDAGVVRGVRTRGPRILAADLVVDASGRSSRLPRWLADAGLRPPREDRVEIDLGYTSRTYRRRPEQLGGYFAATVSTVPRSRGGGVLAIEGDRWSVTLAGMLGDHPPADDAGFVAFARSLPVPVVHDVVCTAEPLDEPTPYRFGASRWRRLDLAHALPDGLVVVGDAVCSLNPLYAQGMTVAAQHAMALRDWLGSAGPRRTAILHERIARVCADAWKIATSADLALPEVAGERAWPARLRDAYVARLQRVAHADPVVARTVIRVANLTDPPSAATTPELLLRALRPGADPAVPIVHPNRTILQPVTR